MIDRVPIVLQGISWSRDHGHPLLLLRALDIDVSFAVVADVDEARALSTCSCMRDRTRMRLAGLIAGLLQAVGASILDIVLHLDDQGSLRATLRLASPRGLHCFDIPGSDGLLIAQETGVVPVMAASELLAIDQRSQTPPPPTDTNLSLPPDVQAFLARLERFGALDDQPDSSE